MDAESEVWEAIDAASPPPNKKQIVAVTAAQLITMPLPKPSLLLAPWLPEQGLCMVYAPRGIGKTFFALGVAYAVASGGKFLCWHAPAPRRVLYIDGEMPANVMQERLSQLVESAESDADDDALTIITPDLQGQNFMPNLSTIAGQNAIEPHLEGINLIVVDNLSTLCRGGIENDSESWLPVQQWALKLRSRGISILFVHHAAKGGQQRGTSRREDILNTVINLKRPADYSPEQGAAFEIHFEKNRGFMGEDAEPLDVCIESTTTGLAWRWKKLESSTYEKVIELSKDGLKPTEIASELEVNRSTVSRHLKKANAMGAI